MPVIPHRPNLPPPPPPRLKEREMPPRPQEVPDAATQGIAGYIQAHQAVDAGPTGRQTGGRGPWTAGLGKPEERNKEPGGTYLGTVGGPGWMGGGGGAGGGVGGAPAGPAGPDNSSLHAAHRTGWSETYHVAGAPAWWHGLTPDTLNPVTEYATLVNAMLPFMSPEDQRTAASNLSQLDRGVEVNNPFEGLVNVGGLPETDAGRPNYTMEHTPAAPLPPIYPVQSNQYQYLTSGRAAGILSTLDQMRGAMGKSAGDFGPGYQYLRDIASVMQQYGGASADPTTGVTQTRQQYLGEMTALDPLLAQSQGTSGLLSAYGPVAGQLTNPFSGLGGVRDASRGSGGQWQFEQPNKWLY